MQFLCSKIVLDLLESVVLKTVIVKVILLGLLIVKMGMFIKIQRNTNANIQAL